MRGCLRPEARRGVPESPGPIKSSKAPFVPDYADSAREPVFASVGQLILEQHFFALVELIATAYLITVGGSGESLQVSY